MEKNEGNKLIAEFMGWKLTTMNWKESYRYFELSIKYGEMCYINNDGKFAKGNGLSFKYHSSWDWLMPVVEKICQTEVPNGRFDKYVEFTISNCESIGWIHWLNNVPGDQNQPRSFPNEGTWIERTWLAVIEFIKWHNANPTK